MQPNKPTKPPASGSAFAILAIFAFILMVGGCVHTPSSRDGAPQYYVDMSKVHNAVPHYLPKSKYGNRDYHVDGRWYHVLKTSRGYDKRGIASWYGTKFDGRLTSTHEKYNLLGMTAASPDLPIPCYVRVTNLQNGRQVIVKVNDRGPFAANRIMDLSYVAARKLGYEGRGTALVQITSIDMPNPLEKTQHYFAHHNPQLYLQVGAFSSLRNAENLESRLKHITSRSIRIVHEHPRTLYRVARARLGRAITVIN
ncbi:MAG: septal ring lytic transglycosylase RlpA family protein [Gammaproteobacteria bacterium]|nr:septal ring lytic transglycosylase RlpA family protein [Gammaproteobacteria bacterium]